MKTFALALALLATTMTAHAVEYGSVLTERSAVSFTSKQMGVPVEGRFNKFSATVKFDPAKPEAAQATIEIDLASVDAGSKDANDEVVGKGWFNVREYPKARFVSSSIKALGNNKFEARGVMSIKGKSRDMAVSFSYRTEGTNGVFEGSLPLQRTQFGIGEGMWADTSVVADEVPVKFRLLATTVATTPNKK